MKLSTVILAAGKGTRMKSDLPKVLHTLLNKSLIQYVIDQAEELQSSPIIVVVGYKKENVIENTKNRHVIFCEQNEQLGTGHAVLQAKDSLKSFDGNVLILSGDVPLLQPETLRNLLEHHLHNNSICSILSAITDNPSGYGRIIRNTNNEFMKVVEHKDATDDEKRINEINTGIYIVEKQALFNALNQVKNTNAQKEYYLPDIVEIFKSEGLKISAIATNDFDETRGINTIEQLLEAESILKRKYATT